jgi:hypothetical protein
MKVINLDSVIKELNKFGQAGEKLLKEEILDTATAIEVKAAQDAPTIIKQRVNKSISDGGLKASVFVEGSDPLAAYYEFGTGASAREILAPYPQEVKDVAFQFYITGEGTLRGVPYLYPNFFREAPKMVERLKKELDRLAAQ